MSDTKDDLPTFLEKLHGEFRGPAVTLDVTYANGPRSFDLPKEFDFLKRVKECLTSAEGPDPEYPDTPYFFALYRDPANGRRLSVIIQGVRVLSPTTYDASMLPKDRVSQIKVTLLQRKACAACGDDECHLHLCNGCWKRDGMRFYYCSKECQTKDWKAGHKNFCK